MKPLSVEMIGTHTQSPGSTSTARSKGGGRQGAQIPLFARTEETRLPTVGGRDRVYVGEGFYYCTALYCATFCTGGRPQTGAAAAATTAAAKAVLSHARTAAYSE